MQVKLSKTLKGIIAQVVFNTTKAGIAYAFKDILAVELLNRKGSLAHQLLAIHLKTWELADVIARIQQTLLRQPLQPADRLAEQAQAQTPEAFFEAFEQELLRRPDPVQTLSTAHALQSIVADRTTVTSQVLEMYGITPQLIAEGLTQFALGDDFGTEIHVRMLDFDEANRPEREHEYGAPGAPLDRFGAAAEPLYPSRKSSLLDKFGTDLTEMARKGEIDPVVGRDGEIERVVQILSRRKKNNPILIGEAGVGKSAIVEGLALRMAAGEVPATLAGKRLFSLDLSSLVAGTKFRGEFEERMQQLLDTLLRAQDTILFIDEIHTIVGAGSTQGGLDTANILKPALARGELQTIGATTLDEYRQSIESDAALERRFQKILVEPPSPDQTLEILRNIAPRYEEHHRVRYTDEALQACVALTGRYITDRCFPDKAIDVLDEAGSRARLQVARHAEPPRTMEAELAAARHERREAVKAALYDAAAEARVRELTLRTRLEEGGIRRQQTAAAERPVERAVGPVERVMEQPVERPVEITAQHICQVITAMTGIPATRISDSEQTRLQGLRGYLAGRVVGQDEAVERISRAILRSRAGLKDERRPIGVFLFVGPTGVGKTLLAKELSRWLFDERRGLIRIDMSEYGEKHNVARLIGAPPGYVGYGEGGQLTEAVRRQPYAVVLFDEIEKAHPDVFNTMLQIFDEGQLTDGAGRRVDFRNTILIMTSNVGSRDVAQQPRQVGYGTSSKRQAALLSPAGTFRKALEQTFAPEFLNRIDDIVLFRPLARADVERIVEIELQELLDRTGRLGYTIKITGGAKRRLAAMGYEERYGARALKRTLLNEVEEPLSGLIIDGKLRTGGTVVIESGRSRGVRLKVAA